MALDWEYTSPLFAELLRPTPSFLSITVPQDSGTEMCPLSNNSSTHLSDVTSRKRKRTSNIGESECDDDTGDDSKSTRTTDDSKKQNHSVIEKRRRDKMNLYITELASMVPICHAMSRKVDKLSVLRMAVQHLKTIHGNENTYPEGHYKPSFLSDQELKTLILQAVDGFLFVVGCDRGKLLYVSESVSQILNYTQADLLGQSWFDILHPKDVAKVKEQLSSSDISPRERFIDAKTMLPVKADLPQGVSRLCPGARRSFFCRMKSQQLQQSLVKEESGSSPNHHSNRNHHSFDRKYCVIQCTGYLKSCLPAEIGLEEQESDDSSNVLCLVAFGRIQPTVTEMPLSPQFSTLKIKPLQFTSRHAMDGKFLFVDHRSTLVLNFLPQELLGTSMYEHFHPEDIPLLAEAHKSILVSQKLVKTATYRFKTKGGSYVRLQTDWKSFKNPWTKDVEYLIANNSLISTDVPNINNNNNNVECGLDKADVLKGVSYNLDFYEPSDERDMQQLITNHVESSKIGSQIVEEVLESQRRGETSVAGNISVDRSNIPFPSVPDFSSHIPPINTVNASPPLTQAPSSNSLINQTTESFPLYNNVNLTSTTNQRVSMDQEMMDIIGTNVLSDSNSQINNTDGNDEAAMAVIMSLLEADAGLGGPVDFSGLPWPLP